MKKWILKAVIQKLISILPFSFQINYIFQRFITRRVLISDEFFETMLTHFAELDEYATKHNFDIENKTVLELGTGWHPVVPICFYLCGASKIKTVDLRCLIRKGNLLVLIQKFLDYNQDGRLLKHLPKLKLSRIENLAAILSSSKGIDKMQMLDKCYITQAIGSFQSIKFNAEFDVTYSINVLEHVNEKDLDPIISKFRIIQKQNGIGYHAIGVYDHFVHVDQSISKFNYLRFSKNQWKIIDNKIQPQNRLRISQFRDIFKKHEFKILDEILWKGETREIEIINVHSDFEGITDIDIPYGTFLIA